VYTAVFPDGMAMSHLNVVIFASQSASQELTIFAGQPTSIVKALQFH